MGSVFDNGGYVGTSAQYGEYSIVSDGLVLALDAGDRVSYPGSDVTWFDMSGNGYNASIQGTNRYTSANQGKFDFRGISNVTDFIVLPHQAAQATTGNYSLIFWMQPQSNGARYFHSCHSLTDNNHQIIQITTTVQSFNGGSSISFANDEIMMLSLVRSGSNSGLMYKNNENPVDSTLTDLSLVVDGGWILNQEQDSVGGSFDANQNAHAAFMGIFLYNRVLLKTEIQQNYNALKGRYGL
jgi:hypothetical protein